MPVLQMDSEPPVELPRRGIGLGARRRLEAAGGQDGLEKTELLGGHGKKFTEDGCRNGSGDTAVFPTPRSLDKLGMTS
jgi:hypothetical protein